MHSRVEALSHAFQGENVSTRQVVQVACWGLKDEKVLGSVPV